MGQLHYDCIGALDDLKMCRKDTADTGHGATVDFLTKCAHMQH